MMNATVFDQDEGGYAEVSTWPVGERVALRTDDGSDRWELFDPSHARALAAALTRAADEAEGRERPKSSPAREMALNAVSFAYSGEEAEEYADDIVSAVRDEVARDLEQMDGTNAGISLTRSQAVRVARTGLTPWDVQHRQH